MASTQSSAPARPSGNGDPLSYTSHISEATAVADETGVLDYRPNRHQNFGTVPNIVFQEPDSMTRNELGPELHSVPGTATQRLLDTKDEQFASYPSSDEKPRPWNKRSAEEDSRVIERWTPLPLRAYFWIPLVLIMIGGAIALEIALHFSNKNKGWAISHSAQNNQSLLHYVYTLPPVIVAMVLVAMWAWTDIEIKKMQPYVDLIHGDSPPARSILLDYTRTNNFVVWGRAFGNKHYLVALASLMVILTLCFQPLAAALFTVRDTWWTEPDVTVNNLRVLGLNQDAQFQDLTSFMTATGFASASVLYGLGDPPFVHDVYTVAPFELPTNVANNGTVFANTTAVKSDPGCRTPQNLTMEKHADGQGWTNTATYNNCTLTWMVDKNATNLFGTDVPTCEQESDIPPQFRTVVFWFFTYQPAAAASATFCNPSISLVDVTAQIDLASGNLTSVKELGPTQMGTSNFSSASGNLTGAPLNGRAYNGIEFNLTNPDRFVLARQDAVKLQMPASVFQAAQISPEGLIATFGTDKFVQLSTKVYSIYLKLIAKTVYFLPVEEPITVQLKTVRKRLWLSDVAVHLLAVAMLLLAFFGTILQLFHRADRADLYLAHQPGTIASAISIGGSTGMGNLLDGRQKDEELEGALMNKKFRISPHTMKIIMEGEDGYEDAASPGDRRRSVFGKLQAQRPNSRRFSRGPMSPSNPMHDA